MAKYTKQVIHASFLKLLNDRPLDQITVKDIVESCGVNRKTFYYYYQDIYELVEECVSDELTRIRAEFPTDVGWQEAQKAFAHSMLENKTALMHVYRALDYEKIEQAVYEIGMKSIPSLIRTQTGDVKVEENDLRLIVDLCSSALAGCLARWVRDGMNGDPDEMIDRMALVMKGTVNLAVNNAIKLKADEQKI